jgi:mono/diheme cytochrome c family protein
MKRILWAISTAMAALGIGAAALMALNLRGEGDLPTADTLQTSPALVARGEYLSRVGNCMACHTVQGAAPYAGGRGIETPFGVVHSSNLTPDALHGIGAWTSADFWRAMHHGRSRDGRLLYPAFPYPNYTQVTREDSDAIYLYLKSLPPVAEPNRPHALRFPYSTQAALGVWRALFFSPGSPQADPARTAEWNRGAYLVNGLGHCTACHTPRNALGATNDSQAFTGGLIPVQNWYAPALNAASEAGVAHWATGDVVALLRNGVAPQGSVLGPMAEVVFRSTQYLSDADARAMAVYLQALVPHELPPAAASSPSESTLQRGGKVYDQHCAQCHGEEGAGEPGVFPPLKGNRAVVMRDPTNVVRAVLQGGYLPATAGNPRPHGMPPFQHILGDEDIAAVTSFVRNSWGNRAPAVGTIDVYRARERRGQ